MLPVSQQETALATPVSIEGLSEVFEPFQPETLDTLFEYHARIKARILSTAAEFEGDADRLAAVGFFQEVYRRDTGNSFNPETLFQADRAVKALNAECWSRALKLTDILDIMPQARRDEWSSLIQGFETPPFEQDTVISTLKDLLSRRPEFLAERVEGLFHALSPDHVTNSPKGFNTRMILANVHNGWMSDYSRCGVINDLRAVAAKFRNGAGEPPYHLTSKLVETLRGVPGEWHPVDGGAFRMRVYIKGTAHIEVHPDLAWKLNMILASRHPAAIPEIHRKKPPKRKARSFKLFSRLIPYPVLSEIQDGDLVRGNRFRFSYRDGGMRKEATEVLQMLGGVLVEHNTFEFPYPPAKAISEVVISGMLPDREAYQFYPTPADIAQRAVDMAEVTSKDTVLEPSAGLGSLVRALPVNTDVTVVEQNPLFCTALAEYDPICTDFLAWNPTRRFSKIVMNPPFNKGRWEAHLDHAASMTALGGTLVAILPEGAKDRRLLPEDWTVTLSEPIPFPGTSIRVVIMRAVKQ